MKILYENLHIQFPPPNATNWASFTISNWLMLLREIITVSTDNNTEHKLWGQGAEILVLKRVTTVL